MDDNFEVVNQHLIKYRGNEKVVILPIEVKYIDSYAFYNTIVQRLVISDSVERIYSNAIVSCGTLKEIIISVPMVKETDAHTSSISTLVLTQAEQLVGR